MVVVGSSDGPHLCVALEIETRESSVVILGPRSSALVSGTPEQHAADERTGAARRAHASENMYIRARTVQIEQNQSSQFIHKYSYPTPFKNPFSRAEP